MSTVKPPFGIHTAFHKKCCSSSRNTGQMVQRSGSEKKNRIQKSLRYWSQSQPNHMWKRHPACHVTLFKSQAPVSFGNDQVRFISWVIVIGHRQKAHRDIRRTDECQWGGYSALMCRLTRIRYYSSKQILACKAEDIYLENNRKLAP